MSIRQYLLKLNAWQLSLVVFFTASLIVLLFWLFLPGGFQEVGEGLDYPGFYQPVALNLLQGNGFVWNDVLAMRYPPGFPLIIAFCYGAADLLNVSSVLTMSILFLMFSAGSSVIVFIIGNLLWGKIGGLISSTLWMTYPFHLWLTKQANSEPPFIFFLLLGFLFILMVAARRYSCFFLLFAGMVIGFSMLIRPIAIGMGVILAITYWLIAKEKTGLKLSGCVLVLLGNMVAILPWEYSAYTHTGMIIPLSSMGPSSARLGFTFPVKSDGFRRPMDLPDDVTGLAQKIFDDPDMMSSTSGQIIALSGYFREYPLAFLKLMVIKMVRVWYGTDTNLYDRYILPVQLGYLLLFIFSASFAATNTNTEINLFRFILPSLFYFWAMTIFGMPLLRYMVPISSLLFLFTPSLQSALNGMPLVLKRRFGRK